LNHFAWKDATLEEKEAIYECLERYIFSPVYLSVFARCQERCQSQDRLLDLKMQRLKRVLLPQHLEISKIFQNELVIMQAAQGTTP
jgi:hypothetical protein